MTGLVGKFGFFATNWQNVSIGEDMATQKFVADFMLVANHYMLEELGELDEAKQAARNDMAAAEISYAAMAKEIGG